MALNNTKLEAVDDIKTLLSSIDEMFAELEADGTYTENEEETQKHYTAEELEGLGYYGPQVDEILEGYKKGVNAEEYMNKELNWKQMREIRFGLMQGLDVSAYNNILYSAGQMQEIRLGLEDGLDVSSYAKFIYSATDMRNMRLKLSETDYISREDTAERQIEDEETGLTLIISKDSMDAYIIVTDKSKRNLSGRNIKKMLNLYGITYGYISDGIKRVTRGELKNIKIRVAAGERPTEGKDGYFELFFDRKEASSPIELTDGSVDYRNKIVENIIKKGTVLAKYHPAIRGISGRTVTDVPVVGVEGKQQKELTGHGIRYLPESGQYIATDEGYVFYDEAGGILNVWKDYCINGDVNCYTGNIDVDGRLHITGSVEDGAVVKAKGDIIVDGYVAGARLESEQNVVIHSGVNANGKGIIIAKGSVNAAFFENAQVNAAGNVVADYYLNSAIFTDSKVIAKGKKSRIMGGDIKAMLGVEANYLGGYMASSIMLDVGNKEELNLRIAEAKNAYAHTDNEIAQLVVGRDKIESRLSNEELMKNIVYLKTLKAIEIKNEYKTELEHEIERLEKILLMVDRAYIKVGVEMQANSRVIIGNRLWHITGPVKHMELRKNG